MALVDTGVTLRSTPSAGAPGLDVREAAVDVHAARDAFLAGDWARAVDACPPGLQDPSSGKHQSAVDTLLLLCARGNHNLEEEPSYIPPSQLGLVLLERGRAAEAVLLFRCVSTTTV